MACRQKRIYARDSEVLTGRPVQSSPLLSELIAGRSGILRETKPACRLLERVVPSEAGHLSSLRKNSCSPCPARIPAAPAYQVRMPDFPVERLGSHIRLPCR